MDILSVQSRKDRVMQFLPLVFSFTAAVLIIAGTFLFRASSGTPLQQEPQAILVPDPTMSYLGKADAKLDVILVADPLCPGCKAWFDGSEPEFVKRYVDTGKVKFYHWPAALTDYSYEALEAMYCAGDEGKFWEYRSAMLGVPRVPPEAWAQFTTDDYKKFAQQTGLSAVTFSQCLADKPHDAWIRERDAERSAKNLNVGPTIVVLDKATAPADWGTAARLVDRILNRQ